MRLTEEITDEVKTAIDEVRLEYSFLFFFCKYDYIIFHYKMFVGFCTGYMKLSELILRKKKGSFMSFYQKGGH